MSLPTAQLNFPVHLRQDVETRLLRAEWYLEFTLSLRIDHINCGFIIATFDLQDLNL
jgi:hypothetical protein